MIQRHMAIASEKDLNGFDHFNDFTDTIAWLKMRSKIAATEEDKKILESTIKRLSDDHEVWIKGFFKRES